MSVEKVPERAKVIFEKAKESNPEGYKSILKVQEEMVEMFLLAEDRRDWESMAIRVALDSVTEEYIDRFKDFVLSEYFYQKTAETARRLNGEESL